MKFIKSIIGLLLALVIMAILMALLLPAPARATDQQGYPSTIGTATNLPAIVNTATASNQTSVVTLRQNRGLGLSWTFNTSGASNTSNSTIWIWPTVDGTNFNTVSPWIWVVPANNTTNVTATTNWSRAALEGYVGLNISTVSNASASYIVTNKGVVWAFPNN